MKKILIITAVLCMFAVAIIGCLFIFELMDADIATSNLVKIVGGIALLGGCSAVVALLMGSKNESSD